jgi:hypothetical protein
LKTEKFFTYFPHFKFFQTVGAQTVLWDILDAMKIGFRIQKLPKFTKKHVFRVKIRQKKKLVESRRWKKLGYPIFICPRAGVRKNMANAMWFSDTFFLFYSSSAPTVPALECSSAGLHLNIPQTALVVILDTQG